MPVQRTKDERNCVCASLFLFLSGMHAVHISFHWRRYRQQCDGIPKLRGEHCGLRFSAEASPLFAVHVCAVMSIRFIFYSFSSIFKLNSLSHCERRIDWCLSILLPVKRCWWLLLLRTTFHLARLHTHKTRAEGEDRVQKTFQRWRMRSTNVLLIALNQPPWRHIVIKKSKIWNHNKNNNNPYYVRPSDLSETSCSPSTEKYIGDATWIHLSSCNWFFVLVL